jgi:uncharacterized repeat protein (TIGR02543 family)
MKLNRKGFVITAILYGLLLLFVMLVSSYLLVLSARKNRLDNLVQNAEDRYLHPEKFDNAAGESGSGIHTDTNKVTITFDTNDYTIPKPDSIEAEKGKKISEISLPTLYKEGFTFVGWTNESLGTDPISEDYILNDDLSPFMVSNSSLLKNIDGSFLRCYKVSYVCGGIIMYVYHFIVRVAE